MKKVKLSSLICLVFAMIMFVSAVSVNAITCYPFVGDSGTQSFVVHAHSTAEVRFQPWKTGTWRFEAYHFNPLMYSDYVNVFAHWRDASNPSDPWHYFNCGTACFYKFLWKFDCYSGEPSISYRFDLVNYTDYPMTVKIKLTKLN